jgi:hypothetical protein
MIGALNKMGLVYKNIIGIIRAIGIIISLLLLLLVGNPKLPGLVMNQ